MSAFLDCHSCTGFLPPGAERCPHCGEAAAPTRTKTGLLGTLATVAVGGMMSITLMACYGVALTPCENQVDADDDGYFTSEQTDCDIYDGRDCDDTNPNIHPGADDPVGDGIDQNCDDIDGVAGGGGSGGTAGTGGTGGGNSGGGGNGGSAGATGTTGG